MFSFDIQNHIKHIKHSSFQFIYSLYINNSKYFMIVNFFELDLVLLGLVQFLLELDQGLLIVLNQF